MARHFDNQIRLRWHLLRNYDCETQISPKIKVHTIKMFYYYLRIIAKRNDSKQLPHSLSFLSLSQIHTRAADFWLRALAQGQQSCPRLVARRHRRLGHDCWPPVVCFHSNDVFTTFMLGFWGGYSLTLALVDLIVWARESVCTTYF